MIAWWGAASLAAEPPADLVLRGGALYTMDAARSWAEAVAVRDGEIVFVGRDREVEGFVGPDTKVVPLDGHMVLPAFQDAHIHPIAGGLQALACDLTGLGSAERYVEAVRDYARAHPEEPWIVGGGWSMAAFGPGALARRGLLDAVVPDRPVYLESQDGHSAWVNSRALEIAGITRDTPDPKDGRIDRDPATGDAIGSLQEGATALVYAHVPPPTAAQRLEGLRHAVKMLNGYGITAIQDAHAETADLKTYRELDGDGALSLRVVASLWWRRGRGEEQIPDLIAQRRQFSTGNVTAGTVKIMQDGVMENYTAVLLEPYLGMDTRGIPMVEPQALKGIVTKLDAEGFQVHFHAIGDGAIRHALDAIEAARARNGNLGRRHHISHLQLIDPADIPRFRPLGVIANFQPVWAFADDYITELTIPFIGEERSRWLYPIASVQRSGAMVVFGSDWSVSTANPLHEIEVAVTRMGPLGETAEPFLPGERIELPVALAAFTINAAYVNGLERQTGSIETGKLADLIVLDRNLFEIDAAEISDARVTLTLFAGAPVYGTLPSARE
jgi:predicted amidohydrolase YtcJ